MKLLVSSGADLNAVNTYGNTALILAVSTGNQSKDLRLFYDQSS